MIVKKFDVCLMNPPYDKNLHLKFLRKTVELCDTVVNISPCRWLLDPFANDKRSTLKQYSDVAEHIKTLEIISDKEKQLFNDVAAYSDFGIYVLTSEKTGFDYNEFWKHTKNDLQVSIIKKCCYTSDKHLSDVVEKKKIDGIRVPLTFIAGNRGCLPTYKDISVAVDGKVDGEDWTKKKKFGGYTRKEGAAFDISIKFDTEAEAQNFYDSYQNFLPLKGLCKLSVQQQHIQDFILPFFDDYSKEITEEWFAEHFNLTKEELAELKRLGQLKYNEKS